MRAARWKIPLAVTVLLALLLALVFSGQWPELRSKLPSSPKGLLAIAPNEIERIGIRLGADSVALRRQPGGWTIDGVDGAAPAELVSHVDTALKFLKVSEPSREIPAGELTAESFAAFGLDPPIRGCRARNPFGRRGDGKLWDDKSGGHVALCQAGRRAERSI